MRRQIEKWGVAAGALLVGFLLGIALLIPGNRDLGQRYSVLDDDHKLLALRERVASALIETYRGNYEAARQTMGQVFTEMDSLSRAAAPDTGASLRTSFVVLLKNRDMVITRLARNDPSAADDIYGIYSALGSRKTPGDARK